MLFNLGPYFKTVFRNVEDTDTRQAIQREERDIARRNDEEEEDTRISIDLWEDKSSVSVDALLTFLQTFIQGQTFTQNQSKDAKEKSSSEESNTADQREPTYKAPKDTQTAKAVSAYQSMNEKTAPAPQPQSSGTQTADADLIAGTEARDIFVLIEDLEVLKERGVSELFIEPAVSFVESLKTAVMREKSTLNIK
ncbi:MAG: hypothetical protein AAF988_06795 [Pseudomonadota bacterium]